MKFPQKASPVYKKLAVLLQGLCNWGLWHRRWGRWGHHRRQGRGLGLSQLFVRESRRRFFWLGFFLFFSVGICVSFPAHLYVSERKQANAGKFPPQVACRGARGGGGDSACSNFFSFFNSPKKELRPVLSTGVDCSVASLPRLQLGVSELRGTL